jgi:molybdate transport system substrate-binding protein
VKTLLVLTVVGALIIPTAATASTHQGMHQGRHQGRQITGDVTVLAAASLTEAFNEIGELYEQRHADTDVTFSFSSSSTLATQIEQGAPADVFASADHTTMDKLVDADLVGAGAPETFARNRLAIAVEPGNPERISTLADTVADDVTLVLCAPAVPCGKYALEAYAKAGTEVPAGPTGANAKDTLTKVSLGEADAAVVYVTDVLAAGDDVDLVRIPARDNVVATYPLAVVDDAPNVRAAKAFVQLVRSRVGQRILRSYGFLPA